MYSIQYSKPAWLYFKEMYFDECAGPSFPCSYNEFGLERLSLKKMENHHNNISDDLEFSEQIIWIMIMIL